ncbi:MAG: hypothetical protein IH621_07385 [Krumholzibacteria bacterium]|nr:hypothetical protein [Candidatus Krumholzibacteria bacterium]
MAFRQASRNRPLRGAASLAVLLLAAWGAAGCLGEPEIEERWTLLEFTAVQPQPNRTVAAGQPVAVDVGARITYRAIRTGFLVAEARYCDPSPAGTAILDRSEHTLAQALAVERILASSVSAGRATRAVTGFDHLVQEIDLAFSAVVPPGMLSGSPDSVAARGLFLVLYLAEGEEIERADGTDTLVVTPFPVEQAEVLFTGFPLQVTPGGSAP